MMNFVVLFEKYRTTMFIKYKYQPLNLYSFLKFNIDITTASSLRVWKSYPYISVQPIFRMTFRNVSTVSSLPNI